MARDSNATLETYSQEDRRFPPPPEFVARANAKDRAIYERAANDLEGFWAEQARQLTWRKPFTKVLEWEVPYAQWFGGGESGRCRCRLPHDSSIDQCRAKTSRLRRQVDLVV